MRRFLTWHYLAWLLILAFVVITVIVMIWASKQPPIHDEPGPPLSRNLGPRLSHEPV